MWAFKLWQHLKKLIRNQKDFILYYNIDIYGVFFYPRTICMEKFNKKKKKIIYNTHLINKY